MALLDPRSRCRNPRSPSYPYKFAIFRRQTDERDDGTKRTKRSQLIIFANNKYSSLDIKSSANSRTEFEKPLVNKWKYCTQSKQISTNSLLMNNLRPRSKHDALEHPYYIFRAPKTRMIDLSWAENLQNIALGLIKTAVSKQVSETQPSKAYRYHQILEHHSSHHEIFEPPKIATNQRRQPTTTTGNEE